MTKIMLVEDDKSLREIYSIRLVAEGYNIVSAGDGEEGLALAVQEKPDLIIADVMMPKISGFDMLDILRSTPETANVKVIMMTALSSDDQRQRGEALGANKYLVKSQVGIEDVVNTVHELLQDAPNTNAASNLDTVAAIPVKQPAPGEAIMPATPAYDAQAAVAAPQVPQAPTAPVVDPQALAAQQAAVLAAQAAVAPAPIAPVTPVAETPVAPAPAAPAAPAEPVAEAPVVPAPVIPNEVAAQFVTDAPAAPVAAPAAPMAEMPVMEPSSADAAAAQAIAEQAAQVAAEQAAEQAAAEQAAALVAAQAAAITPTAPVTPVVETPVAPVVSEAPVAPVVETPAVPAAPVMEAAPVAETPVVPVAPVAPAVPAAPTIPPVPEAPVVPEAPAAPEMQAPIPPEVATMPPIAPVEQAQAPQISSGASAFVTDQTPELPNASFGQQTSGGERVIQPIGDINDGSRDKIAAEMDAILNGSEPPIQTDNPFNVPTPPQLNIPSESANKGDDKPSLAAAEPKPELDDIKIDDFSDKVSEKPIDFGDPEEKQEAPVDTSEIDQFERDQVANASENAVNAGSLEENNDDELANIEAIQPAYMTDLTSQLLVEGENNQSELENPLAAQMARELADDPVTLEAERLRESGEAEEIVAKETGNILSDDEINEALPDFLKSDNLNAGSPNIQSSDEPLGGESAEEDGEEHEKSNSGVVLPEATI